MMDIMKDVLANKDLLIEMRRHLHEYPELSGQEFNTLEYIKGKLDSFGVKYTEISYGGILAEVGDASKGKTVLLRGDMDALPMQENPENLKGPKAVVSKVDGACHACGHDGHTAMLLIAAKVLKAHESELKGRVLLIFERSEEVGAYCKHILRYFQREGINPDAIYATHLLATFETGKISMEPGGVMSGATGFDIEITGQGGHGSRPDLSRSPIDCFSAFYAGLQALRLKYISPFESLTLSVGSLHAGAQGNIIPDSLRFTGTARYFSLDVGFKFNDEFVNLLENTCKAYYCTYTIHRLNKPTRAVINNADLSALGKRAVTKYLGAEYIGKAEPWMASESFNFYLALWPGIMAHLGMKNPEKGVGAEHHNEHFDIDEDVLPIGAAAYVAYALEVFEENITPEFTPFNGTPMELLAYHGYDNYID